MLEHIVKVASEIVVIQIPNVSGIFIRWVMCKIQHIEHSSEHIQYCLLNLSSYCQVGKSNFPKSGPTG